MRTGQPMPEQPGKPNTKAQSLMTTDQKTHPSNVPSLTVAVPPNAGGAAAAAATSATKYRTASAFTFTRQDHKLSPSGSPIHPSSAPGTPLDLGSSPTNLSIEWLKKVGRTPRSGAATPLGSAPSTPMNQATLIATLALHDAVPTVVFQEANQILASGNQAKIKTFLERANEILDDPQGDLRSAETALDNAAIIIAESGYASSAQQEIFANLRVKLSNTAYALGIKGYEEQKWSLAIYWMNKAIQFFDSTLSAKETFSNAYRVKAIALYEQAKTLRSTDPKKALTACEQACTYFKERRIIHQKGDWLLLSKLYMMRATLVTGFDAEKHRKNYSYSAAVYKDRWRLASAEEHIQTAESCFRSIKIMSQDEPEKNAEEHYQVAKRLLNKVKSPTLSAETKELQEKCSLKVGYARFSLLAQVIGTGPVREEDRTVIVRASFPFLKTKK